LAARSVRSDLSTDGLCRSHDVHKLRRSSTPRSQIRKQRPNGIRRLSLDLVRDPIVAADRSRQVLRLHKREEIALLREGIALPLIQRQLGHSHLSTTGTYLQGISSEEIISTVHARRAPMMHASAGLEL
jgi:integrase